MPVLILTPSPTSSLSIMESTAHPSKSDAANIRIMTAAIVVLLSVVLFIVALHLYAKWFWKSVQNSQDRRHPSEEGAEVEIDEAPEVGRSTGLQKSVIESLPAFTYSAESLQKGVECAVCLCELEENEKGRFLPKCSHIFHTECIDTWFRSHSTCPLCRISVAWPPKPPIPIDFTSLDIVLSAHSNNGGGEASSGFQQETLPIPSPAEYKPLNKQQMPQERSAMAPLHFVTETARPLCEPTCSSCSSHPPHPAAQFSKSPRSRFSLRRILSRDTKVAPSVSIPLDFFEEDLHPSSMPCHSPA